MEQRVDFITLGVPDVEAARRFYVEGLGWRPSFEVPGDITFIQVGHGRILALWGAANLAADVGAVPPGPMTLSHNVATDDDVRRATDLAVAAEAAILKPPQQADFGGFHSHVADPAGFVWEICHNPGWSVAQDGTVTIGPID